MGNARNLVFWVVLFVLVLALFNLFNGGAGTQMSNSQSYSEFVEAVENDTVATDEIRFGDNDRLAAQIAATIGADQLDPLPWANINQIQLEFNSDISSSFATNLFGLGGFHTADYHSHITSTVYRNRIDSILPTNSGS